MGCVKSVNEGTSKIKFIVYLINDSNINMENDVKMDSET
jgi:hypothetical protein